MTTRDLEDELLEVVHRAAAAGLPWDAIVTALETALMVVDEESAEDLL